MKLSIGRQQLSLIATLVIGTLLFAGASLRYTGFASAPVLVNLFDDNAFLGIAAIGMTFVILSGGIDLSVGAVIGLSSLGTALLVERLQLSPALAIPLVLLAGSLFGAVMGSLIAFFDLAPFLVTLAGMFFARGLAFTLSLDSIPLTHPLFAVVSQMRLSVGALQIPPLALAFLTLIVLGWILAKYSRFGRAVYALGGNAQSARMMGLPIARTQVLIYTLSGGLAALAGVVYTFYTSSGNATAATGLELDAIAAVVIGGTLLTGGVGSIWGTLAGTLILGMIQTIITFEATLSSWWTRIVIGALLFLFVALQRLLSSVSQTSGFPRRLAPVFPYRFMKLRSTGTNALLVFVFVALGASSAQAARISILRFPQSKCGPGEYGGRQIGTGTFQLTGTFLKKGMTKHPIPELPDPAPPYINERGEVEIYGSARYFIRYRNWKEFSEGGCFRVIPLDVRNPSLSRYAGEYTHPWDIRKYRVMAKGQPTQEVLLGGAMSPTQGRTRPRWPDDNINRRIFFFFPDPLMRWVRDQLPIVGTIAMEWLGHSYGGNLLQRTVNINNHNVIRSDSGEPIAYFYEKVSDARNNSPFKTEIFAARMTSWNQADPATETRIMSVGNPPFPATRRTIGGFLVEGPRPIEMVIGGHRVFVIGFSSGDFPTDSYSINYMYSRSMMGPYRPILTAKGNDLLDLGEEIKKRFGLSWVGRPSFYRTPDGSYEMLFHGVLKEILDDNDYTRWPQKYDLWEFFRCLFKTKVEVSLAANGAPIIHLPAEIEVLETRRRR